MYSNSWSYNLAASHSKDALTPILIEPQESYFVTLMATYVNKDSIDNIIWNEYLGPTATCPGSVGPFFIHRPSASKQMAWHC